MPTGALYVVNTGDASNDGTQVFVEKQQAV